MGRKELLRQKGTYIHSPFSRKYEERNIDTALDGSVRNDASLDSLVLGSDFLVALLGVESRALKSGVDLRIFLLTFAGGGGRGLLSCVGTPI
jgi:hypothetical protein